MSQDQNISKSIIEKSAGLIEPGRKIGPQPSTGSTSPPKTEEGKTRH